MDDDIESIDQEPDEGSGEAATVSIKTRRSFTRLRRELSDEELASPAVQRMLLDDIERLEREALELSNFRKGFHEVDKRAAVLEEKLKKSVSSEIIFGVCLSLGAAAIGYAPALWTNQPSGYLSLAFGSILIISGIVSRLVKR